MSLDGPELTGMPANGGLFQPPFTILDEKTTSRLQDLRRQTPRYLFRAWKNTHPYISGGYATLNTPNGIVPLAFRAGRGHSSVYDMTKADLTNMVVKHIRYETDDFLTEFSSWTASLSFAMLFCGADIAEVYISIIDTHALKPHNDFFFVPGLAFLTKRGNLKSMHHEYLAHGPIRGNAYRALPLSVFLEGGYKLSTLHIPGKKINVYRPKKITECEVRRARSVAKHYGHQFAVPVALALLCLQERSVDLFMREGDADLGTVLKGLSGFHIPHDNWSRDDTIMEDATFMGHYIDIRQFIHLMRAIVRQQLRMKHLRNATDQTHSNGHKNNNSEVLRYGAMDEQPLVSTQNKPSAYKWFVRFTNGEAKIIKRSQSIVSPTRITKSAARVVKPGNSRTILKVDTAALERAMKKHDDVTI